MSSLTVTGLTAVSLPRAALAGQKVRITNLKPSIADALRPISLKRSHQSKRGQRIIATAASIPRGGSHPRTARRIECVHVNIIFPKFKGDAPIRGDRDIAPLVDQYSTVDTD